MFKTKKFDVSKANNYRYTLIKDFVCYDFIVRDGKVYIMGDAKDFKVFDPRLIDETLRIRCDFDNDTHTYFIFRTKIYPDKLRLNNDVVDHKIIIIQDYTPEINMINKFNPTPKYENITNLYYIDGDDINFSKILKYEYNGNSGTSDSSNINN